MAFEINATSPCLIPFQASGFRLVNGTLVSSASVTLYVYNSTTDVIPQYNETFATGLQNGYISVTMGNTSSKPLNLNWGVTYWLALDINGVAVQMVDYGGVQTYRKSFISTQGEITSLTVINSSITGINNLSYTQISSNIGNWSNDQSNYVNVSYIGGMNNLSYTQISNNIGNWSNDKSNYVSTSYVLAMNNLSLTQIVANIGNWTLDKISYASTSWVTNYIGAMSNLTLSQISANLGNWTLDKPNYATINYANAINNLSYSQIATNIGNWTRDLGGLNNLSYTQISANIGNWSADKSTYATQAYANAINNLTYSLIVTNIGNFSAENSTVVRTGTKTCTVGQALQNVTGNSSGIYGDCVTASSSSSVQYNTSVGMYFNKTTTTYTGSLTSGTLVGYMAGHAICNATYSGTHFCSQEEVMETIWHTNVSTMATWSGTAWVNSGAPKYAPATTPVNDCNGWTSAVAASYLGNYWAFSTTGGGVGATINCGTSVALACCGVG